MGTRLASTSSFEGGDYAKAAIGQIPRSLSLLDRNPASPTYGCFDRSWWLDRSTDFPNALAQNAIHGLALVWAHPLKDNPYYQNTMMERWARAGLAFLVQQAHGDGSFDEFYPNERGWSGPSGFLLYAMLATYELLGIDPDSPLGKSVCQVASRCARMHLERTERGVLANHYAMAFLSVAKAWRVLKDDSLLKPLHRRFEDLLKLQNSEGWFQEYDGPDPGYLCATVSFIAKMEREGYRHSGLRVAVEKALGYLSYFIYPDGTFGGALGSRQTVHLYPHGLEYYADVFPLARSLAGAARKGFAQGGFVPPAIQSDHYYHYRINELLEASLAAHPLGRSRVPLPFEKEAFQRFFLKSRVLTVKSKHYYAVVNLRKGGVLRAYAWPSGKAALMDSGVEVQRENGSVATSNWINPSYGMEVKDKQAAVWGRLSRIPFKTFNPIRFLAFRLVVLVLGVVPVWAECLKGFFRRWLTLGIRPVPIDFERRIRFLEDSIQILDHLHFHSTDIRNLWVGAELPLRYVPQSRHFQKSELNFIPASPSPGMIREAGEKGGMDIRQMIHFPKLEKQVQFHLPPKPSGNQKYIPQMLHGRWRAGLLAVAVSLSISTVLFLHVGVDRVFPLLSRLQIIPLMAALGLNLFFPLLAAWRWRSALRLCGLKIPFRRAFDLTLVAWPLATVTPMKLGSLIQVWALRKEGKNRLVLWSLFVERIFDLPVLIGLSLLGGFWVYPDWRMKIGWGVAIALGMGWILGKGFGVKIWNWMGSRWSIFPGKWADSKQALLGIGASSVMIWVISMIQWQSVLYALGVRNHFLDSFLRVPVSLIAGMIPVTWMGVGTRDGAFLMVYAGQMPMEKILAASLIFTSIRYLVPGLLGLPWTFRFIHRMGDGKDKTK